MLALSMKNGRRELVHDYTESGIARFNNEKLVYTVLIHVEKKQMFSKIAIC